MISISEVVFDPRLGRGRTGRYRDPKTARIAPNPNKGKKEQKGITFGCKFCEESKPLDDIMVLTGFFPLMIACRACKVRIG